MGTDRITAAQVKKIHASARERGIDSDLLHELIYKLVKKDSIKLLTRAEAAAVIDSLEGRPSGEEHMSQKQGWYILSLAKKLGWTDETGKVDKKRLDGMCEKYAKISRYDWLTRRGASDMIEALKGMASRMDEGMDAGSGQAEKA